MWAILSARFGHTEPLLKACRLVLQLRQQRVQTFQTDECLFVPTREIAQ
jgi:hypothetical protein